MRHVLARLVVGGVVASAGLFAAGAPSALAASSASSGHNDFACQPSAWVDIVGHSEGAFQSLYVPKVLGYGPKVGTVVALAPPTHGTTFAGLVTVADGLALRTVVDTVLPLGCAACDPLDPASAKPVPCTYGIAL